MAQSALSNRQRRIMKKGRPRLFSVPRQPNGQPSRAKGNVASSPSWFAPELVRAMNKHPIDMLEERGRITADQRAAAYNWIADRRRNGLPYTDPPALDMDRVRAAENRRDAPGATRRYHEVSTRLQNKAGVYGYSLAYETIIQARLNKVLTDYFWRIEQKMDPTERQHLTWQHLQIAFREMEHYYATQLTKKPRAVEDAA